MEIQEIIPKWTQRAFLCGMTGSGKTTLAEFLIRHHYNNGRYVVIYDAKKQVNWQGFEIETTLAGCQRNESQGIIFKPRWEELEYGYQNAFCKWIFERQHTLLYVDEVYMLASRYKHPEYYRAIASQGRELGISLYNSSQRPKDIPAFAISESEYAYVFNLVQRGDRLRITECYAGLNEWQIAELEKEKFQFFFYNVNNSVSKGPLTLSIKGR